MKEIQLSTTGKNKGKYIALVDDEDYEYLNQWKWYALRGGNTFHVVRNNGSRHPQGKIWMHRVILKPLPNMTIDHIDHNGLNNQKSNLRVCTKAQNLCNIKPRGKLKYLGVSMCYGKYRAQIRHNNKVRHLGMFDTEIEAAQAYDRAALELHGEFTNLNFK